MTIQTTYVHIEQKDFSDSYGGKSD